MRELLAQVVETVPGGKVRARDLRTLIKGDEARQKINAVKLFKNKSRARELFPNAHPSDLDRIKSNPDDIEAFLSIIATGEYQESFNADKPTKSDLKNHREYAVNVTVRTYPERVVKKTDTFFVTENYLDSAKLLAIDLYDQIVAELPKNSHVAVARATVKLEQTNETKSTDGTSTEIRQRGEQTAQQIADEIRRRIQSG